LALNTLKRAQGKVREAASFLSMVTISPLNFFIERAAVKSPARSHTPLHPSILP